MAQKTVELDGFDAALRKLASLPAAAQREADELIRQLVGEIAGAIRADAGSAGRQAARAAESVTAEGAAIVGGGPFFFGSVFGGRARPETQQFKPYLGHGASYWFFTVLVETYPDTRRRFEQVVDIIAREWDR